MDWRKKQLEKASELEKVEKLPAGSDGSDQESSDSEDDSPPREFFNDARALIPGVNQRRLFLVWDRTRGVGGGTRLKGEVQEYSADSARVQAAFGMLFDLAEGENNNTSTSSRKTSPAQQGSATSSMLPTTASTSNLSKTPLFRPLSPPTPPAVILEDSDSDEYDEAQAVARRKEKGKGRMVEEILELSDDSEDDTDGVQEEESQEIQFIERPQAVRRRSSEESLTFDFVPTIKHPSRIQQPVPPLPRTPPPVEEESSQEIQFIESPRKVRRRSSEEPLAFSFVPTVKHLSRVQQPIPPPTPVVVLDEDDVLREILAIVPDVLPSYISTLFHSPTYVDVNGILDTLFSASYPKVEKVEPVIVPSKRGRSENDEDLEVDYLVIKDRERPDVTYQKACLEQLYCDFDRVHSNLIKSVLQTNGGFFSPTYTSLRASLKKNEVQLMASARTVRKPKAGESEILSASLEKEKKWLKSVLIKEGEDKQRIKREQRREEEDGAKGLLLECQCCFTDFCFDVMVQCSEAHLFCRECVSNLVSNQIGNRQYKLSCMADDCSGEIIESEAAKVLSKGELASLQKIKTEREIAEADIEGLAHCPFCPYAYVIENNDERLFHCARAGCEKISCRKCQKLGHVPLSCREAEKDSNLGTVHQVEEAMSAAAIRNCPKCKNPYVKQDGCNFITCSSCHGYSCHMCQKIITGHGHFGRGCVLHDDTEVRTHKEIEDARKLAAAKALADNPAVEAGDLAPLAMDELVRKPPVHRNIVDDELLWRNYDQQIRHMRAHAQPRQRERPPQHNIPRYHQGVNLGGLPIPGFNAGAGNYGGQQRPPAPIVPGAPNAYHGPRVVVYPQQGVPNRGQPVVPYPQHEGAVARHLAGHTAGPGTPAERREAAIRAIQARSGR